MQHLSRLVSNFPNKVIQFDTTIASPIQLEKFYQDSDRAAVFDHDLNEQRFRKYVEKCDYLNKKYGPGPRKPGQITYHAYSNINFDLWLILHKENFNRPVTSNHAYQSAVRRIYGLAKDDNIKKKGAIKKILDQISLDNVKTAILRADEIKNSKLKSDMVITGQTEHYGNPDFSINYFLRQVLTESGDI